MPQCVRYNSVYYDPSTEAVDAFSQDWSDETSWVNPPWQLLGRVVVKLQEEKRTRDRGTESPKSFPNLGFNFGTR